MFWLPRDRQRPSSSPPQVISYCHYMRSLATFESSHTGGCDGRSGLCPETVHCGQSKLWNLTVRFEGFTSALLPRFLGTYGKSDLSANFARDCRHCWAGTHHSFGSSSSRSSTANLSRTISGLILSQLTALS